MEGIDLDLNCGATLHIGSVNGHNHIPFLHSGLVSGAAFRNLSDIYAFRRRKFQFFQHIIDRIIFQILGKTFAEIRHSDSKNGSLH